MIAIEELRELLRLAPDGSMVRVYEGEFIGIVIETPQRIQLLIEASAGEQKKPAWTHGFDEVAKTEAVKPRYMVVNSSHLSFTATVVDTTRPEIIGGKRYDGQFEIVCECIEKAEAELVCLALNLANERLSS